MFHRTPHNTNEEVGAGGFGKMQTKPSPEQMLRFRSIFDRMMFWLLNTMIMSDDSRGHWRLQLFEHHLKAEQGRGKLRDRGPLYAIMMNYLRGHNQNTTWADRPSLMGILDGVFDDICHAVIDDSLERQERARAIQSSDDDDEMLLEDQG
jgi:hypothetical protein